VRPVDKADAREAANGGQRASRLLKNAIYATALM